ncbi:putative transporter [Armadillidium vulgare]|nr:putative transporter [Armadillidium vulgare]
MALSDFDDILIILGLGKWNLLYYFSFGLYAFTIASFILAFSYVTPSVQFACDMSQVSEPVSVIEQCNYVISQNETYNVTTEELQEKCTSWIYNDTYFDYTLTSEFNLVCGDAYLRPIFQTMITVGGFVGTPINGYLSDKYGRRTLLLIASVIAIFSVLISTLATNLIVILVLRFFTGLTTFPAIQTGFTICMEASEPRLRTGVGMFLGLPWALGTIWWGALGYMIKDWRWLLRVSTIPGYLCLALLVIISESPRWMIVSGSHAQALKAIKRAGKWNNATLPSNAELMTRMQAIQKSSRRQSITEEKKAAIKFSLKSRILNHIKQVFVLFSTPQLRKITILMYITFVVSSLVFYGLSFSAINFKLDPFMYMIVGGLMEIPAYSLVVPIIVKTGMIPFTSGSYFICGITILILAFIPSGTATIFLPETRNKHLFETVSQLEEAALKKKNRKGTESTKDEAEALTMNEKPESNTQ